jgi:hypothetical protein
MRSEARLLVCSVQLLWHSLFPVLVMSVPLVFVLAQMAAWYQYRPPVPGSETVLVTMQLQDPAAEWPEISITDSAAVRVVTGPVHVFSRAEVYWEIEPVQPGAHELHFRVADQEYAKTFGAGTGFMRLNPRRSSGWADLLLFPLEKPLPGESPVRSIQVDYPERPSRLYGTDWWILYFCVVSMIFALLSKPFIKIRA